MDLETTQTEEMVLYLQKWLMKNPAADPNTDQDRAFALLSELNGLPITVGLLRNTGIYRTVKRYRKESDDETVRPFGKKLLKKWKDLLKSKSAHNSSRNPARRDADANGTRLGSEAPQSPVGQVCMHFKARGECAVCSILSDTRRRIQNSLVPNNNKSVPGPSRAATIDPGRVLHKEMESESPPPEAVSKRKSSNSNLQAVTTRSIEVQTMSSGDIIGFMFESDFVSS